MGTPRSRRGARNLIGCAVALFIGAPVAAAAQATLAPPNPQQARCIEAFADTQEEKELRAKFGEPPKEIDSIEGWDKLAALQAWATARAIAIHGSEKAALAFGEKAQRAKYTRRLELLRKSAQEGHLPSLYLLVTWPLSLEKTEGIHGLPTAEERSAAFRTLYDHRFPFAPRWMAAECNQALDGLPEEKPPANDRLCNGNLQDREIRNATRDLR